MSKKQAYDVTVTVRLRIKAADEHTAENLAITLMDNHLGDMLDCMSVAEVGLPLTPTNPHAELVCSRCDSSGINCNCGKVV